MFFSREVEALKVELENIRQPWLILLRGNLGVGKTTFTKELLESFSFPSEKVQSPTFLKILEYQIPNLGLCVHMDAYRIEDSHGFERLSLEAYSEAALFIVEWPEIFLEYLQNKAALKKTLGFSKAVNIDFEMSSSGERKLKIILQDV